MIATWITNVYLSFLTCCEAELSNKDLNAHNNKVVIYLPCTLKPSAFHMTVRATVGMFHPQELWPLQNLLWELSRHLLGWAALKLFPPHFSRRPQAALSRRGGMQWRHSGGWGAYTMGRISLQCSNYAWKGSPIVSQRQSVPVTLYFPHSFTSTTASRQLHLDYTEHVVCMSCISTTSLFPSHCI